MHNYADKMDGVIPSRTCSIPMLRRFGVGPISISDNERWLPRPADDGLLMIVAPQRYGCLPAGRVTDLLYDCVTDQPLPLSLLGD